MINGLHLKRIKICVDGVHNISVWGLLVLFSDMYWLAIMVVENDWLIMDCLEFSDEICYNTLEKTSTAFASGRCLSTFPLEVIFKVIVSSLPYTV
jgi:hypothetical protein